jgi:toxin-antitoxin system PIN domain toxin
VILVDANLLIYAHIGAFQQHEQAREWLDAQLNGATRVGLAWASLLAFLRVVTNPRIVQRPVPIAAAWQQVGAWLDCENAWIPLPTDRHHRVLGALLESTRARGDLVPDAHLAALALEHGLELCSTDGDFARFPEVRWRNPLQR